MNTAHHKLHFITLQSFY